MRFSNVVTAITFSFTLQTLVIAGRGDYSNPSDKFKSCSSNVKVKPAEFVDLHNIARKSVGAGSVSWDQGLANTAQCWANRCVFEHSHTQGLGENIAAGSGPYTDQNAFVDWWEEFKIYRKGDDYSEGTGHFTQVAWKNTKKIGCGSALCPSSQLGLGGTYEQARFIVCEYFPPGNVLGTFSGQVNTPSYDPMANMGDYGQDDYSDKYNDDTPPPVSPHKNNTSTGTPKTKIPTITPSSGKGTGATVGTGSGNGKNTTTTGGGTGPSTPSSSPNNGSGTSSGGSGTCNQGGNDDYSSGGGCTPQKPARKHIKNHHGHKGGSHKPKPKPNSRYSTNSGGNPSAPATQNVPQNSSQNTGDYQKPPSQSTDDSSKQDTGSQPPATDNDSGNGTQTPTSVSNTDGDNTQNTDDYQTPPSQDDDEDYTQPSQDDDDDSDDYSQPSQDDDDDDNSFNGPISISLGGLGL